LPEHDIAQIVEAVLFAADAPVSVDKLEEIIGDATRADIRNAIRELNDRYESEGHAFTVTEVAGGVQLYCRPEYSQWIKELHKGRIPTRLSQAALETLAMVAYKQPVVRAEIEATRGVDSSGVLSTLLRRNLIRIVGRAQGMGRALMYGTTKEFLRYFGLNAITDLPRLEEFAEVLGLKPEEIELAVEGAESLAGIEGAGRGQVVEEEPASASDSAHPLGDREVLDAIDET
jgi:segregation and condensation protein B